MATLISSTLVACGGDTIEFVSDAGRDPSTDLGTALTDAGVADLGSRDVGLADYGPSSCTFDGVSRVELRPGRITGDGCHECYCAPGVGTSTTGKLYCLSHGCAASAATRCRSHEDCGQDGFCHFDPGCTDLQGWCARQQSECDPNGNRELGSGGTTSDSFCGCDGVTYSGDSCFGKAWARRGPC